MTVSRFVPVVVLAVATAALAIGALVASNQGFKLDYDLVGSGDPVSGGTSVTGTNTLGLPFNRRFGLDSASALMTDIGSDRIQNIQRYVRSTGGIEIYADGRTDFNLDKGEGYFVRIKPGQGVTYRIRGSHDPGFSVRLVGSQEPLPEGGISANGTNFYAHPYHGTATNAAELFDELGSSGVSNIQRYVRSNNGIELYAPGGTAFDLIPGEAYFVRLKPEIALDFVPAHF